MRALRVIFGAQLMGPIYQLGPRNLVGEKLFQLGGNFWMRWGPDEVDVEAKARQLI